MTITTEPAPPPDSLEGYPAGLTPPAPAEAGPPAASKGGWRGRVRLDKIGLFIASLALFILALTLMKEGARDLAPLVRDGFAVTNVANGLGFGWLFAYVIMSGSPVAAAALTFFEVGVIDHVTTFAMITGSRLGASFIVLFIGFIYVLRGRDRATSLSMGLLSLIVTGVTYLAGLAVGLALLRSGVFNEIKPEGGLLLSSIVERVFEPIAGLLLTFLPRWALFLSGLGIIILSFNLFDRCLPKMSLKESQLGRLSRLVYKPGVMFALGAAVTLISMSVSVSLSILVPLSQRGFVRRENVIPYIMGANITTFIDTLLAAALLTNPLAFTIVLVEMVSITLVSLLILSLMYRPYEQAMLSLVAWITADAGHLWLFMSLILVTPLILMWL